DFIRQLIPDVEIQVDYVEKTAVWEVKLPQPHQLRTSIAARETYGTARLNAIELLRDLLNSEDTVIWDPDPKDHNKRVRNEQETLAAQARQQALKEAFANWVWTDEARATQLADLYNDRFNAHRARKYDGGFLDFPGLNVDFVPWPHQKNGVWRIIQSSSTLLAHEVGAGKAQPLTAKILTPVGWKEMGDIRVGDDVIAGDGTVTKVRGVYPQDVKPIYRVTCSDGSRTECCDDHLWLTFSYRERCQAINAKRFGKNWACAKPKVRTLSDIRRSLYDTCGAKNHLIPQVGSVQFAAQPTLISPYLLGVLLGDGTLSKSDIGITSADPQIIAECSKELPSGARFTVAKPQGNRCPTYYITTQAVQPSLIRLGLLGKRSYDKFVPDSFKFNTADVRLAVLQGLMDTDGTVSRKGHSTYFDTSSERLASDVQFLVESLGGLATTSIQTKHYRYKNERKKGAPCYHVTISMPPHLVPFRLERKTARFKPKTKYPPRRFITDVNYVGDKPAQCIAVAHPSQLYVTDDFIVTHNTSTSIIATAELLRMGLIHKSLFVVPNHIIGQWAEEFARLYPNLRVVCAGEDDLKPDKRGEFLARVATGDSDVYVVMHSQFRLLPVRPETLALFIQREVDELEDAIQQLKEAGNASYGSLKDMQRSLKNYYAKLDELATMKHDDAGTITFDEMGIDLLVIDEFHLFKNLQLLSRRKRIAGMAAAHSQRAYDMYIKMTLMAEATKRRLGLTATPVTNTMLEVFTMQRFFQKTMLEELGIDTADAWMNVFAEAVTGVEVAPTGKGFRLTTRLAKWHNLPELAVLTRQVMDVVAAEDLKIPKPTLWREKPMSVVLPRSRRIDKAMDALVARAEALRSKVDPAKDNMLKIVFEARCLSLDPRLLAPGPEEPNGKVNAVAQTLYLFWRASAAFRGTQMVFCDLGVPSTKRFEQPDADTSDVGDEGDDDLIDLTVGGGSQDRVYGEIKRKLIDMGVPAGEIAFIHDAKKRAERQALFKAMNDGRVRILIGSTEKMGTGTNAQKRLIALHNLDIPWRPDQLIQRIGRIARQGNDYDMVFVANYLVEGTFDAFMLQTQENKARFITQFTAGEITARTSADVGDFVLNCAEMKALASGDSRVQRRVELEARLQRLDRLYWAWKDARWKLEIDVRELPDRIERQRKELSLRLRGVALRDAHQADPFGMRLKVDLKGDHALLHTDKMKAGDQLVQLATAATQFIRKEGAPFSHAFYVGEYLGFDLWLRVSRMDTSVRELHLYVDEEAVCKTPRITESGSGRPAQPGASCAAV
ncbi:MAG: hypothetical protein HC853_00780, partial [Anaerolineae bacterium]|nr:hypothetical protein [Anaerolineae bacterium]